MTKRYMINKRNIALNKANGFTLIELIVVILILAVLAAVAMPRFTNLQTDARIAKLNAARGAVASASTLIHASILSKNGRADTRDCAGVNGSRANNISAAGTTCTENGLISVVNGYPTTPAFGGGGAASATNGILAAAGLTLNFNPTEQELNNEGYGYAAAGSVATFSVTGGPSGATCSFTYTESPAPEAAAIISVVNTAGC